MKLLVMDPAKLKVVELRSELSKRGLDTKGNKAILVERLRKALEEEESGDHAEEVLSTETEDAGDTSKQDEHEKSPEPVKPATPKTSGRSQRSSSGSSPMKTPTRSTPKTPVTPVTPPVTPVVQEAPVKPSSTEKKSTPVKEQKHTPTKTEIAKDEVKKDDKPPARIKELQNTPVEKKSQSSSEAEICTPQAAEEAPEIRPAQDEAIKEEPAASSQLPETKISEDTSADVKLTKQEMDNNKENDVGNKISDECLEDKKDSEEEIANSVDENDRLDKFDENEENMHMETNDVEPDDSTSQEMNSCTENKVEELKDDKHDENNEIVQMESEDIDMKSSEKAEHDEKDTMKDRGEDRNRERKDRKRKRSTSSQDERHKSPSRVDDEPEIDYSRVLLSWYDSDLNLVIDKSKFLSATPMHNEGFGYVWAGARASFGFTNGKIYYEVKITHQCNVSLQDEEHPHILRAGWSAALTSMQLGEEKLSYGYDSTGKKSTGNEFSDYGSSFGLNDILGCYLDMTGDEDIVISYTLNAENFGEAFRIPKSEIDGKALFPHILTKNCAFVCNFGDEEPWNENILDDYTPVGKIDESERTTGPRRPDKREDCEMLMMCGLPAAGKTVWANKYAADHSDKMFNVLGTSTLLDKMKVTGLPRKRSNQGQWDMLVEKCTRCLTKLVELAATRRRNYILDQRNVYPSEQRRKMRHFYGFQRKAIVIILTDEELKSRIAKREAAEGKDVPDSTLLDMKANFSAPVVGESFSAVEWIELGEDEAKKLIVKYNKEGKDAGYGSQPASKRPRFEKSDSHRDSRDVRSSRDSRDSRDHRDRRSGYSDRNRSSSWRGGNHMGGSGGWRDRGPRSGGPHMRHGSGGYGGSSSGWRGRGGPSSSSSHRGSDRRVSSTSDRRSTVDRNRSGPPPRQGGGWGSMNSSYHNSSHSSGGGWGGGSQHSGGGWSGSGQSQSQGSWGSQQSSWSQPQGGWGSWKGYSQSGYNQSNYGQQGYGNGNWASWNQQQYYNQYWGQQQQSQSQSITSSGQTTSGSNPATSASTASSSAINNYPGGWQGYSQSYYSTDSSSAQQQK